MRYRELDIARGFTVLMMPAVHVTMLYGNQSVYDSWWGIALNWIATMPGAQLFMLLMGMSFGFSAGKNVGVATALKSGRWLLLSYTLNFFKFSVPAIAGWLPASFFSSLGLVPGSAANLRLFLVGDILQLAACSLGIIYVINRFALPQKNIILLAAVLIVAYPWLTNLHVTNPYVNELLSLVTGNDPLVFFPVFPWLLFPLMGLVAGRLLKEGKLHYAWLSLAGAVLLLPEIILHGFHFSPDENLYRPTPTQSLYHLGFCFIWLAFCKCMAVATDNFRGLGLLDFCSKHITLIYCIQWIAIFWCIAIIPYRGLALTQTIIMSLLLSCLVFLATYFFIQKNNPLLNRQQYG